MDFELVAGLLGGIGLFLLGMRLMTDGLKLAAGQALRNILSRGTGTRWRGFFSGVLITGLVQSSSAVTVATIGFVNAGLLSVKRSIGVIYGSNVGTTMTAWLVAAIGFHVNIKAFALPLVGIGMVLMLIGGDKRTGHIGKALAGFGVFFMGIDVLKEGFGGIGDSIDWTALDAATLVGLLAYTGGGILMTFLMQSSSAAMAIALTAAAGGGVPLLAAAAMVVGANVGTTTTAGLAVIGATPKAKRVAAAHMLFNVITGVVALIIMQPLLALIAPLPALLNLPAGPATELALFHTAFNLLGVVLLWPLTTPLVNFLSRRFRRAEQDEATPQYLDENVLETPVLAMNALVMELDRIGEIARRMFAHAVSAEIPDGTRLAQDKAVIDRLMLSVGQFSRSLQQRDLPQEMILLLPDALRVSRYYASMAYLAIDIAHDLTAANEFDAPDVSEELARFKAAALKFVEDAGLEYLDPDELRNEVAGVQSEYQLLKSHLLRAGSEGRIKVAAMVQQLDITSRIRRSAEQAEKASRYSLLLRVTSEDKDLEQEQMDVAAEATV